MLRLGGFLLRIRMSHAMSGAIWQFYRICTVLLLTTRELSFYRN